MKKLIFASVALAATISANAQTTSTALKSTEVAYPEFSTTPISRGAGSVASSNVFSGADTVFYESFGNGLSGDGSNGAWTNEGMTVGANPIPANWEYRGTSTNPNNTVGTQGAYGSANQLIASPTVSNGFMIFDSDYLDTDGNQGQFGSGQAPTPHWGALESPSMDVSSYNDVVLVLNSYMRRFAATTYVAFSLDGGTTWQDSLIIHDENDITTNTMNALDNTKFLDVSSIIGGESNVKMRFLFDGENPASNTGSNSGYYHWQVDDIAILEKPAYDLEMVSVGVTGKNDTVVGVDDFHYARIPVSQAPADTLLFAGKIRNKGTASSTGTKIEVTLNNTVVASSNTPTTIAVGATDSIEASAHVLLPAQVGAYAYSVTASADSVDFIPADNVGNFNITVTDSLYRYGGSFGGRNLSSIGAYEVCAGFEFWNPDTIGFVQLRFGTWVGGTPNLKENDPLKVSIKQADGAGGMTEVMSYKNAATGDFYIVPANQADTNITFLVPVTGNNGSNAIPAGQYYACYKTTRPDLSLGVHDDSEGVFDNDPFPRAMIQITGGWEIFRFIPWVGIVTLNGGCDNSNLSVSTSVEDTTPGQGKVTSTVNGGLPAYSYSWTGPNSFTGTTKDIENLSQDGTYNLTVTDGMGCEATATANVGVCVTYDQMTISATPEVKVGFPKDVTLSVTGGSGNYSYSWTGPNGFTANTKNITATEKGDYQVTVSDDDCTGVNDQSTTVNVPEFPASVGDVEITDAVSMYPNPSKGNFDVKIEGITGTVEMVITNVTGQTVETRTIAASGSTIESVDLTENGAGVYFIELKSAEKSATFRAVVD